MADIAHHSKNTIQLKARSRVHNASDNAEPGIYCPPCIIGYQRNDLNTGGFTCSKCVSMRAWRGVSANTLPRRLHLGRGSGAGCPRLCPRLCARVRLSGGARLQCPQPRSHCAPDAHFLELEFHFVSSRCLEPIRRRRHRVRWAAQE